MKIQYVDTDGVKEVLPEGVLGYDKATADRGRVAVGTNTGDVLLAKKSEVDAIVDGTALIDGRDLSVDGTKLDGIESGATRDQNAADVPLVPVGNLTSINVQSGLEELQQKIDNIAIIEEW